MSRRNALAGNRRALIRDFVAEGGDQLLLCPLAQAKRMLKLLQQSAGQQ
jgi:hypothetical protein